MRPLSDQALPSVCAGGSASDICTRVRYLARLLSSDELRFEALREVVLTSSRQHRTIFMFLSLFYYVYYLLRQGLEPGVSGNPCPEDLTILIAHTNHVARGPAFETSDQGRQVELAPAKEHGGSISRAYDGFAGRRGRGSQRGSVAARTTCNLFRAHGGGATRFGADQEGHALSGLAAFQLKLSAPEIGIPAHHRNSQGAGRDSRDQGGKVDLLGPQQLFLPHAPLAEFDHDRLPDLGAGYRSPGRTGILSIEKSSRCDGEGEKCFRKSVRESGTSGSRNQPA